MTIELLEPRLLMTSLIVGPGQRFIFDQGLAAEVCPGAIGILLDRSTTPPAKPNAIIPGISVTIDSVAKVQSVFLADDTAQAVDAVLLTATVKADPVKQNISVVGDMTIHAAIYGGPNVNLAMKSCNGWNSATRTFAVKLPGPADLTASWVGDVNRYEVSGTSPVWKWKP